MNRLAAFVGIAALCMSRGTSAQTLVSNPSLSGSVTAAVTAGDYRYTKHTISSGGRGGHTSTYYSWDLFKDESLTTSLTMLLNGNSGTAAPIGTFYGPTYSATATGITSLTSTAASATFTTTYGAGTVLTTPQLLHQMVTTSVSGSSTFYFTLTARASIAVTANGSSNGALALYGNLDEGVGVIFGLSGPGGTGSNITLGPGTYWITSSTSGSALQDTLANSFINLGTTDSSYSFTLTFTKSGKSGGGGGGGND